MTTDRALLDVGLFDGGGGGRSLISVIDRSPVSEGENLPNDVSLGK